MNTQLSDIVDRLLPIFPDFGPDGGRLVVPLFAGLARGRPVAPADLAAETGWPVDAVQEQLDRWWGIRFDAAGRVVGFWGLDLEPTRHRLRLGDRELFAWCAWDTLFLPYLLGEELEVISPCPASGRDLRLRVGPEGVRDPGEPGACLALKVPDPVQAREGVRQAFCCGVDFVTAAAAEQWGRDHEDRHLLSLDEGHRLGRAVWDALLAANHGETAMSDCCAAPAAEERPARKCPCPSCGETAHAVGGRTVLHHLQRPWTRADLQDQTLWFCASPQCATVYFDAGERVFTQVELRTAVGHKAPGPEAAICYCFGVSRGEATPEVRGFVETMTRAGLCACETRNPAGRCCLRDFPTG